MKIIPLLLLLLFLSCTNQVQQDNNTSQSIENTSETRDFTIDSIDYFIGKWSLEKREIQYINSKERKVIKTPNCENKSYWEFITKENIVLNRKVTIKSDCNSTSTTTFGQTEFKKPNQLNYFIDDIGHFIKITPIDHDNFYTVETKFIGGKSAQIYQFYQRIK